MRALMLIEKPLDEEQLDNIVPVEVSQFIGHIQKRIEDAITKPIAPRMMNIKQLMEYTSLGKNKAIELAKVAQARRRIDGRVLYDKEKLDEYFDDMEPDYF